VTFLLKIISIFLFLLLSICNSSAQLINVKPTEISSGEINFNPEIIKKNKVKSISISVVDKPDGDVIIDKGESKGYEFDKEGYVSRYYYTFLKKIERQEIEVPAIKKKGKTIRPASTRIATKYVNDTVFINLFYDTLNRIILKRSGIGDYYDAYYYEYNEQGKIKKELHCKETNVSETKKDFILGVQSILSSETFEYEKLTATQYKKKCLNDEGREYKKGVVNYDKLGNKTSEYYEFMVSWMRQEKNYTYDETSRLINQSNTSNDSGEKNEHVIYDYSKNSNLLSKVQFDGTTLVYETNYMYDENTGLVKSEVNRNHKTASIDIVKYTYTFY
jgi:hypothetical protein